MIATLKAAFQGLVRTPTESAFTALVFLSPLGAVAVRHWSTVIGYTLIFVSFFGIRGQWQHLEKPLKNLVYAFLCFFVVACISFVNSADLSTSLSRLGKLVWLVGFIPLVLKARTVRAGLPKVLVAGFALSGPINAAVAISDVYMLEMERATGAYNPILMGNLTALAILFAIIQLGVSAHSTINRILLLASISCNMIACGLSATKSALLILLFMVPYALWMIRSHLNRLWIVVICLFLMGASAGLYTFQKDYIQKRLAQFKAGLLNTVEGDESDLSVGVRWAMWKAAVKIWKQNPLLGTGIGDYHHDLLELKENNQTQLEIMFSKAHNIYMEALATTGIAGFLALIAALLVFPLKLFYATTPKNEVSIAYPCLLGLITIWSYALLGIANSWLARNYQVVPFVICLAVFASVAVPGKSCSQTPTYEYKTDRAK
jgi:O-antigen ligase